MRITGRSHPGKRRRLALFDRLITQLENRNDVVNACKGWAKLSAAARFRHRSAVFEEGRRRQHHRCGAGGLARRAGNDEPIEHGAQTGRRRRADDAAER